MTIQNLTNPSVAIQSAQTHKTQPLLDGLKAVAQVDVEKMSEKEKAELQEKCQEFESLFVKMLLDTMRKSIDRTKNESGAIEQGKDIYEEMLYGQYAKNISQTAGGLGIGKMIYRQLTTPVISPAEIARRYNQS
ncbi:MAG: rod-binding protein [Spirochaetia bacterium]